MLGISRTIADGKTVEFEFMQIRQETNGEILFIAKPSGQPEATFKLIKGSDREVIFENPQHDFPQRVIYRLQSDGSLLGRIEGVSKGKEKAVDFPMIARNLRQLRISLRRALFPQLVKIFRKRHHRPVESLHLRIGGIDDVIFIRRMGATAMAQTEMR